MTYLTISETADYLKVSPDIIYSLCHVRESPSAKVGRQWRVRQDLLDKWWISQMEDKPQNL